MSFFGLTQLGFQNYLREKSIASKQDPIRGPLQFGYVALPPLRSEPVTQTGGHLDKDQTAAYGPGHGRSFTELTRIRRKLTKNPTPPHKIYFDPPTTAYEAGWITKDEPLKDNLPWSYVPRVTTTYSEPTKYNEDMRAMQSQI